MLKKFLNWAIFLAILTGFFYIGGQIRHNARKVATMQETKYLLETQDADVIFLGNSHIFYAVFPYVINDVLPDIHTTSLAHYPGALIEYYPYIIELAEQEHPPRIIVLDAHALVTDYSAINYSIHPEHYRHLLPNLLVHVSVEEHLSWLLPLLNNHILWKEYEPVVRAVKNLTDFSINKEILQKYSHPIGDTYVNRGVMSDEEFELALRVGVLPMQEYSRWLLQEYAAVCEQHGIQLVLVNQPSSTQWGIDHPEITALAAELEIPLLELNEVLAEEADYDNIFYVATDDPVANLNSHVNTMGAFVSSLALAEYLSAEMDFPLDDETFLQYQEVILTTIDLICSDDALTCTASIMPLVNTEKALYDWRVMGWENDKSVVLERQQKSAELSFTFSTESWQQANYLSLKIFHPVLENMDGHIELRLYP